MGVSCMALPGSTERPEVAAVGFLHGLARIGRAARDLGLRNVARVATYRVLIRARKHPVQHIPASATPVGPFFSPPAKATGLLAPTRWQSRGAYFGWFDPPLSGPPDWFINPFTGVRAPNTSADWWMLPDFDESVGDIKCIWEASRFDWVVNFAQRAAAGSRESISDLNGWLDDWCRRNPPYRGQNWKCGQEASIRVMHLALAALVLKQVDRPTPALVDLIAVHLRRISPTTAYAVGQDNNHGTSEAAALLIGGSWLERLGVSGAAGWHRAGRALLNERVARLVGRDGSFSQYSVNYHRLMLDTLSLVEQWRRQLALEPFSHELYARAAEATRWLHAMTDRVSGDAPNIGANDGANLLPLTDADPRDFRPSVQLAAALFLSAEAYPLDGPWNAQLEWLDVDCHSTTLERPPSRLLDDGGYAVLRRGNAFAVLRYPRFRFRPSHADALHLDFWVGGENLLRDAGSFTYSAGPEWLARFAGVQGHNTIQFDDREPMPRLGRFLWGDWLKTSHLDAIRDGATVTTAAAYRVRGGPRHYRRVTLSDESLVVEDKVDGFARRAVLRWRLRPGVWTVSGTEVRGDGHCLDISSSVPITRCELVEGWESRYYMRRTTTPVLEIEIATAGTITSEYRWTT